MLYYRCNQTEGIEQVSKHKKTMKQWFDILNERKLSKDKITISEMRDMMKHQSSSSVNPVDEMLSRYIDSVIGDPGHLYNGFTGEVLFTEAGDEGNYSLSRKFGKDASRHDLPNKDKVDKVSWLLSSEHQVLEDAFESMDELSDDAEFVKFEDEMREFLKEQPQLLMDMGYLDRDSDDYKEDLHMAAADLTNDMLRNNMTLDKFPNNLLDKANAMVDALVQSHLDFCG
jgi:hypothetical protein